MARIVPYFLRKRLHFLGFLLMLTSCYCKRKKCGQKKRMFYDVSKYAQNVPHFVAHTRIHDAQT